MAQVSKSQVDLKLWGTVWGWFLEVLRARRSKEEFELVMVGLLTPTERVMLTKRLAAALLLLSEWPVTAIADQLKLGTATIYKVQAMLEKDSVYKQLLSGLGKRIPFSKERSREPSYLVELIDDILSGYRDRSRLYYGKAGK